MAEHEDHGHSIAAWTSVTVQMVGFALMAWAVLSPSTALFIIGAVVVIVGAALWKLMGMAGFGNPHKAPGSRTLADAPDEATSTTVGIE